MAFQHEGDELQMGRYSGDVSDFELTSSDMLESTPADAESFFPRQSHDTNASNWASYSLPITPLMTGTETFYDDPEQLLHVDPLDVWFGPKVADGSIMHHMPATRNASITGNDIKTTQETSSQLFGQITPPSEVDGNNIDHSALKHRDSAFSIKPSPVSNTSKRPVPWNGENMPGEQEQPSKKAKREDRSLSGDDDNDMAELGDGDRREKYREKNRVAAAKCRAKKKENVDQLEETHRTQSTVNKALKQTEKALRDELSYWRTHALSHIYCTCCPIHEYNMRQAKVLAVERVLGNLTKESPSMPAPSPGRQTDDAHASPTQPVPDARIISDGTRSGGRAASFAAASALPPPFAPTGKAHNPHGSEAMITQALSRHAEQELKDFVNDVTE